MTGEPTELDQLQLQQRLDMRESAEDVIRRWKDGRFATMEAAMMANDVIKLLDEAEQVCKVASELTKQIKTIVEQRDKMAELLRDVLVECREAMLTETQRERDYVNVHMSKVVLEEIREVIE